MVEQEYLNKLERLDGDSKKHFEVILVKIYSYFSKLPYSQVELVTEHIKRVASKDSVVIG